VAVIDISYSEVSAFRQCPLKWSLGYQHRLQAPAKDPKLDWGTGWHKVQEARLRADLAGLSAAEATEIARKTAYEIRDTFVGGTSLPEDVGEHMLWALNGYIERWGESDPEWETIEVEHLVRVPLMRYGRDSIWFKGYLDLVQRNRRTGAYRIRDYKSKGGKDVSSGSYQIGLRMEDQFPLYQKALQMTGLDVRSCQYDVTRRDRLKRPMSLQERFARVELHRSPSELDQVWSEFKDVAREIVATRRGLRPIVSHWEPNTCGWKCDFLSVHEQGRATGRPYPDVAREFGFQGRNDMLESDADKESERAEY
jgi:hypothetical protein